MTITNGPTKLVLMTLFWVYYAACANVSSARPSSQDSQTRPSSASASLVRGSCGYGESFGDDLESQTGQISDCVGSDAMVAIDESEDSTALALSPKQRKIHHMQQTIQKKNLTIRRLRAQLKTAKANKGNTKPTKKDLALAKQRSAMMTPGGNSFEITKRGRMLEGRSGRLTLSATMAIGLRRSLSNIAAADFGLVTCADISGQTVGRCEEKCSAAITGLMKDFCSEIMQSSVELHSQGQWSAAAFSFRSDSTNSRVWKRQKLHVLEVVAAYVKYPESLSHGDFDRAVAQRRCVQLGLYLFWQVMWQTNYWVTFLYGYNRLDWIQFKRRPTSIMVDLMVCKRFCMRL